MAMEVQVLENAVRQLAWVEDEMSGVVEELKSFGKPKPMEEMSLLEYLTHQKGALLEDLMAIVTIQTKIVTGEMSAEDANAMMGAALEQLKEIRGEEQDDISTEG